MDPVSPGYFVMTSLEYAADLGGLVGANAACLSALTSGDWVGKNTGVPLGVSNVRAWLCDDTTCQGHQPGVFYKFARVGGTSGGNLLYVDHLGRGSFQLANGAGNKWNGTGFFGVSSYFWAGRDPFSQGVEGFAWEDEVFSMRPEGSSCSGWTVRVAPGTGGAGYTDPASCCAERQWHAIDAACDATHRLLCVVDPQDGLDRTPNDVVFPDVTSAELNVEHTATAVVTGISTTVPAIILTSDQANTRLWTAQVRNVTSGADWSNKLMVRNGDTLEIRTTSLGFFGTKKVVEFSIGDRSFSWSVTTRSSEPQLNTGHLLMTAAAYPGDLGGRAGANALCFQEANAQLWPNKGQRTLAPSDVEAFLCDASGCASLRPNTRYVFNRAGTYPFGYAGGAFFYTDASGIGPNNDSLWKGWSTVDGSLFFGANFATLWSGRSAGNLMAWSNTPSGSDCSGWTSSESGITGTYGTGEENDARRWSAGTGGCDTPRNIICAIHPPANGFGFADVRNGTVNTQYTASSVLAGVTRPINATVTAGDAEIRRVPGGWSRSVSNLANGDTLEVRMTSSRLGNGARTAVVSVGDAVVEWVVRNNDPGFVGEHVITPTETNTNSHVGLSLALSGNQLVFALGSQLYVYEWQGASWTRVGRITPSISLSLGDIAMDGNVIVVGDHWNDGTFSNGGVAAIYERGSDWNNPVEHIVRPTDDAAGNAFGRATAISGNLVVIANGARKVYFYEKAGGDWSLRNETIRTTTDSMYDINRVLRIRGSTVVVGTAQVNQVGSVEVFENSGAGWASAQSTVVRPADPRVGINCGFGSYVDLSSDGNTLVVGAGDTTLPMTASYSWEHGLVFVYEKGASWTMATETVLVPPVIKPSVRFGRSVNIAGNIIAVGAPGALGEGGTYLYTRLSSWADASVELVPKDVNVATPAGRMDVFGQRADMCGRWLVTGAPLSPLEAPEGGAIYVHDLLPFAVASTCP